MKLLLVLFILLSQFTLLLTRRYLVLLLLPLHHLVSDFNAVLLAFLVPAPFIHLRLGKACQVSDIEKNIFRPDFILLEAVIESLKLALIFTRPFCRFPLGAIGVQEHLAARASFITVDVGTR